MSLQALIGHLSGARARGAFAIAGASACALALVGFSSGQQAAALSILVRDAAGTPLQGVSVALYSGDKARGFPNTAVTGPDGLAHFPASSGRYIIAFQGSWGPGSFIPVAQQNAGVNAPNGGGFPVTLKVVSEPILFTFVVVQNSGGALLPLIDLSRSAEAAPQPYRYDGPTTGEVVVNQKLVENLTIQPLATLPNPNAAAAATIASEPETTGTGNIMGLVLALLVAGGAVIFFWTAVWRQSRNRRGGDRRV